MSEYIVGLDRMYSITADTPEEAEEAFADLLDSGKLVVNGDDCVTYEEVPDDS